MRKSLLESYNNTNKFSYNFMFVVAVLLSVSGFLWFFISTGLINNVFLLLLLSCAILYPFRTNRLLRTFFTCWVILCACWIIQNLGTTVVPFVLAFIIGYLLDPLVCFLEKHKIPRWISALGIIIVASGIIILIATFVFPILFEQTSVITGKINAYIKDIKDFSNKKSTYDFFKHLGIQKTTIKEAFDANILPVLENWSSKIFTTILNLLLQISNVTTQIINIVILPFVTFYFLKDFNKIKQKIPQLIHNDKLLEYMKQFNSNIRTYISWQIIASTIVFSISSISFFIFNVPFGIVIACIAGVLNPIPYFGMIISLIIATIIMLFASATGFYSNIIIIIATLFAIHFINAYLIEPMVIGNKIGLHPILMILAVFVFNSLFGIIGMLIAVPLTALLVSFIKDATRFAPWQYGATAATQELR